MLPPAEKLQNFFGVFLQFQIGVDKNGHAKRGGGRTRAFPHIAPGEALAEKELLEIAERKLRG